MKNRINLAISKILLLQSEFSPNELKTAITLIKKMEIDRFLKSENIPLEKTSTQESRSNKEQGRSIIQGISRSIEGLDPEKSAILSNLIEDINNRNTLLKLDEIRAHALRIDKNFKVGKTIKDTIPKFIILLRNLPINELKSIIKEIRESNKNESKVDDSYQNLAQFLIKGE